MCIITTMFNKALIAEYEKLLQVLSDKTVFSGGTALTVPKKETIHTSDKE